MRACVNVSREEGWGNFGSVSQCFIFIFYLFCFVFVLSEL